MLDRVSIVAERFSALICPSITAIESAGDASMAGAPASIRETAASGGTSGFVPRFEQPSAQKATRSAAVRTYRV